MQYFFLSFMHITCIYSLQSYAHYLFCGNKNELRITNSLYNINEKLNIDKLP